MRGSKRLWAAGVALLPVAYLGLWPVDLDPAPWHPRRAPDLAGPYAANSALAAVGRIDLGDGYGPEDVAIGREGSLYVGVRDGRILRLREGGVPETFAHTGGRPLGLRFDPSGRLLVADAQRGLLAVGPGGGVTVLATEHGGVPFGLTDDVDVASDGTAYFSDASWRFGLGRSHDDVVEHRPHGRLLVHDRDGRTRLLLDGLYFANGVALAPDESFVLVAETSSYRLRRYWLSGPRRGQDDVFADNLPGFPDGVTGNGRDTFWVALVSPRVGSLDRVHPYPALKKALFRLPAPLRPAPRPYAFVLGLDLAGRVVHNLQDPTGRAFAFVTNVVEAEDALYLGSLGLPAIGRLPWPPRP